MLVGLLPLLAQASPRRSGREQPWQWVFAASRSDLHGPAGSAVVIVCAKSRSITLSATRCAALASGNVRTFAYILSLRCGPRGEGGAPDRLMPPEPVQHDEVLAHTCLWVNSSNPSVSQLEHCAPAPILWPLSRSIR